MRVCIHKGAKEIGGTCVEIEAQSKRIVLDVGLPLGVAEPDEFELHSIRGFDRPDPSLLAVVISHPHQDHYGLAYRLPKETLFMIGQAAEGILATAQLFSSGGVRLETVKHLEDRTATVIGPFTITPYLVDHSAYDAYALLVEADGAALFYSGDFRAHGRKAKLFRKLLRDPPGHVDVLLMEGTTIGRASSAAGFPTESDLEEKFVALFRKTDGMPLVWCSGQNIDRIVTIYRACLRTDRQFIVDMYTADVLRATDNPHVPQAEWERIKVFLPAGQRRQIKRQKAFALAESYAGARIFPEELASVTGKSVMLFRPSMIQDVERAGCLVDARLIYSMWSGYLRDAKSRPFLDWLERLEIPLDECHTSGHASVTDLIALRQAFASAPVVPVHSGHPEQFDELFGNVRRYADGEWWQVDPIAGFGWGRPHSL